jgi:citrate synthase
MEVGVRRERYLGARDAAEELGVSVRTLYAYVSRGLIRSEAIGGGRRDRRYRAEDVRRLKERKERRRDPDGAVGSALDWGTPVMESGITLIEDGRLYYRGRDAMVLARDHSLERVAEWIWTGAMTEGGAVPPLFREIPRGDPPAAARGLGPMEALGVALQAAASREPTAYDLRPGPVARTGARILKLLAEVASGGAGEPSDTVARTLARRWAPEDEVAAPLIDRAMVLCADHELNVSSFTARCVASAGATPYAVVVAGLAALGGVKHGGNTERVGAFLAEVEAAGDARGVVAGRMRRGEGVPGFGHPLYPEGDPRGRALLEALGSVYGGSGAWACIEATAGAAAEVVGERPNVDFALVALERVVGLPGGAALTLFALGRSVGWVGHAIEQYEGGNIIRPRARYVGPSPAG